MEKMYDGKAFSPITLLSQNVSSSDTIIAVDDVSVFPPAPNYATIWHSDGTGETVLYNAITSTTLSGCVRGADGDAMEHSKLDKVARNFNNVDYQTFIENITENDEAIALKANSADVYTKTETEAYTVPEKDKLAVLGQPSLLINGGFDVNTSGETEYTGGETVDNWDITGDGTGKVIVGNGVTLVSASQRTLYFRQFFTQELVKMLAGKTVTLSSNQIGTSSGAWVLSMYIDNEWAQGISVDGTKEISSMQFIIPIYTTSIRVEIGCEDASSLHLRSVKLELGDTATPYYPLPYVQELQNALMVDKDGNISPPYSNPSVLINGDFRAGNVVNQRGLSEYSNDYSVDMWHIGINGKVVISNSGVVISSTTGEICWFFQAIENFDSFRGKVVTLSVKISDGIKQRTFVIPRSGFVDTGTILLEPGVVGVYSNGVRYYTSGTSKNIEYIKLELGKIATPHVPRPYGQELALCQRYQVSIYGDLARAFVVYYDEIFFVVPFPTPMRILPTINVEHFRVRGVNGDDHTGFTFSVNHIENNLLSIRAVKQGHGLVDAALSVYTTIFDANIY